MHMGLVVESWLTLPFGERMAQQGVVNICRFPRPSQGTHHSSELLFPSFELKLHASLHNTYLFINFFLINVWQVTNAILAILAAAATLFACVFASVHVSHLSVMDCQPPANINVTTLSLLSQGSELANASCLCIGGQGDNQIYNYDPLTCREVTKLLPVLLMTSAVINGLACLTSSCYVVLLWSNRLPYMYAGLKTHGQKSNAALKSLYQWKCHHYHFFFNCHTKR